MYISTFSWPELINTKYYLNLSTTSSRSDVKTSTKSSRFLRRTTEMTRVNAQTRWSLGRLPFHFLDVWCVICLLTRWPLSRHLCSRVTEAGLAEAGARILKRSPDTHGDRHSLGQSLPGQISEQPLVRHRAPLPQTLRAAETFFEVHQRELRSSRPNRGEAFRLINATTASREIYVDQNRSAHLQPYIVSSLSRWTERQTVLT